VQAASLPGAVFHDDAAGLPDDRPLLLVGNEFSKTVAVFEITRRKR